MKVIHKYWRFDLPLFLPAKYSGTDLKKKNVFLVLRGQLLQKVSTLKTH